MQNLWGISINGLDPDEPLVSRWHFEFTTTAVDETEARKKARQIAVGAFVGQYKLSPIRDAGLIRRFRKSLRVEECTLGGTLVEPEEFGPAVCL